MPQAEFNAGQHKTKPFLL